MMKASRALKLLIRFRPALRFVKFRILHVDDSPERIARGMAVGLFICYLPLIGIQMLLAWAAASLLRANKIVAVLCVWISNPFTIIPIYYPSYILGRWLFGFSSGKHLIDPEGIEHLFEKTLSFYRLLTEFHEVAFWKEVSSVLMKIGLETFVGGIIFGMVVSAAGYTLGYHGVTAYRRRKQQKKEKRHHRIMSERKF
jgi:uncharacterized protein (DUF2062 family)